MPPRSDSSVSPSADSSSAGADALRYVALGDSYTIGTSVSPAESWPQQLVDRLPAELTLAGNLATNGFSSEDLILHELPSLDSLRPEFVTVQIGVNDVVRGVPESTYANNVDFILDDLLGRLAGERIVAVATPDYTVTPMGAAFGNPAQQSAEIARFNAVLAGRRRVARGSRSCRTSSPSRSGRPRTARWWRRTASTRAARSTRLWVDAIEPVVIALLRPIARWSDGTIGGS